MVVIGCACALFTSDYDLTGVVQQKTRCWKSEREAC
jgi:hypothetical protein